MTTVLQAGKRGENRVGKPDIDSYFDTVYTETLASVTRFVVSHAARFEDVEDIVQNIYTRFYKRLLEKGKDDIENAEAFVINIAKFECRSSFSGFKKRKEKESAMSDYSEEETAALEAELSRDQPRLEDVMNDKILARQIFDDIVKSDAVVGKIFYLHFVCDMKLEEVARELGLKTATVKTKMYRAIERQKKKFGI